MSGTFPVWTKKLIDRVNAHGDQGITDILDHLPLFQRAGVLMSELCFLEEFEAFINKFERNLKKLHGPGIMPYDLGELREWMGRALSMFLGFQVEVPEPPKLNRRQRHNLQEYGFSLFFIPAITEDQYPVHIVKPDWSRVESDKAERIPLLGKWVAFECQIRLVEELGFRSRLGVPYIKGLGVEMDDVAFDLLPMISKKLGFNPDRAKLPSVEILNFMAYFMNWIRENTGLRCPDLTKNPHWEMCQNTYRDQGYILVCGRGGGNDVSFVGVHDENPNVSFRSMVVFPD